MRILKEQNTSLLVTNLGLSGKHYIVFSVLVFSDVFEPDRLLLERDLWKTAKNALPPKTPLDAGMPKTVGEVLVSGSCHALQGEMVKAMRCSFHVGTVGKEIVVFGDRYWIPSWMPSTNSSRVTDPVPFTSMPLVPTRSFGGDGFDKNPEGKGVETTLHEGMQLLPLPNIEYPNRLVTSPQDQPDPAGFWGWSMMHPDRQSLTGTYDEKWVQTHWPDFPGDFNPLFFNVAPPDQRLPQKQNWFSAGEHVEFSRLRPDRRQVSTRLPKIRVRLFVALRKDDDLPTSAAPSHPAAFIEPQTRIDTVHIFPEAGILTIHRAVLETKRLDQDELADVLIAVEPLDTEKRSIDDYFAERTKRLDRTVPTADPSILANTAAQKARAMEEVNAVPDRISAAMDRAMGRAPKPVTSPQSIVSSGRQRIANAQKKLSTASVLIASLGERFGPSATMGMPHIEHVKELLTAADSAMEKAGKKTLAAVEKSKALRNESTQRATSGLDDAIKQRPSLATSAPSSPALFQEPPLRRIMEFLTICQKRLLDDKLTMDALLAKGFLRHTLADSFVGINDTAFTMIPQEWGLAEGPSVEIPAGFVWPSFDGPRPLRIVVLPQGPESLNNAVAWSGFDAPVFVDRFSPDKPIAVTQHPLDALMARQVAGRIFTIATPLTEKDVFAPDLAKTMSEHPVIVVHPANPTPDDNKFLQTIQNVAPAAQASRLPYGTRLYESKQAGTDLLSWFVAALPPQEQEKQAEAVSAATSPPKASVLAKNIKADINALTGKMTGKADALKAEARSLAREAATKTDKPIPDLFSSSPRGPEAALSRLENGIPWKLADEGLPANAKEEARSLHSAAVARLREKLDAVTASGATRLRQGLAKAEAAKAAAADPIPTWAKEMMSKAGVDAGGSVPGLSPKMTAQDVALALSNGESLAGKNLSGLDFSGMNLTGADLTRANIQQCRFTKAILDKALLCGALANAADFSEASLVRADFTKAICSKCLFTKANLKQADLTGTNCSEAMFTLADLSESRLRTTLFNQANLSQARLHNAILSQTVLSNAVLKHAELTEAMLVRCTFLDAVLDEADFTGADFQKTIFFRSSAFQTCFDSITGEGLRVMKMSDFSNTVFTNAHLMKASFIESTFPQADFTQARLERCLFDRSQLPSSRFYAANAANSRFLKCNLERADMRGMNLIYGKLRGSHLASADMRGANLFGVDFFKVGLGQTQFDQANLGMTLLENRTGFIR
ncbi:DUF2169 family type VI secretion system accessory protein [Desulfovibrio inopinatus]|uniref:DUF2169 family type VI secretion system accessory protein n=1 Tax=Desulfovibrio inopinatus TaxID=102109 RepID=UPI0003F7785C|nr:DUF2169 domain-containing protein [Desulfovibrio inopinatus]